MPRPRALLSLAALTLYAAALLWLVHAEKSGPVSFEVDLAGGVPATLTLPREDRFARPPREERPPGVVLAHGYASDRALMSSLARTLARAGYAVLSLDFRGHGANRTPFAHGLGQPGNGLLEDVAAAVDFLRTSAEVNGARIAVMGHSMGAGTSMEYASRDSGLDAAVMISGGWGATGPYRVPNALFIYAALDPQGIRDASAREAAELAGVERAQPGAFYGDFARGTAVAHVEVPGADHLSIVWTDAAAREIVAWLDGAFGREREAPVGRDDPRLAAAGLGFVAFVLLLPGLGRAVGRLAPVAAETPGVLPGTAAALGGLALALALAMPLVAVGSPGAVLSLEVGEVLVPLFAYAGVALLAALALGDRLPRAELRVPVRNAGAAAAVALVAVYALLAPLGVVFHRLALTPERALAGAAAFVGFVPFTLAFHLMLRRGSTARATLVASAGRVAVLVLLLAGLAAGIVPFVVSLMFVPLVVLFALFEVLSASIYATARSRAVIALVEAGWFAWIVAAINPILV